MKFALKACLLAPPLIILTTTTLLAQPLITDWARTYGGSDAEVGNCVQPTNDGGFVAVGFTSSFGAGISDVWLIKTDAQGDCTWSRTYGGAYGDVGNCVQKTVDGGYIIVGNTTTQGGVWCDVWLIKTNSLGDTIWTKKFGGSLEDWGKWVEQTTDGGYIISGWTISYSCNQICRDVWLIKTDALGDCTWSRIFGGTGEELGSCVQQTADNGYIVVGTSNSPGGLGNDDVFLIKTDQNGDTLNGWTRHWGTVNDEAGYFIRQTRDGGYIVTGEFWPQGAYQYDALLLKTDADGMEQWHHNYGGNAGDGGSCVQERNDGYIITGYTDGSPPGYSDLWLIETDSLGTITWDTTFGNSYTDYGNYIQQTADGGYIITGCKDYEPNSGTSDLWLIKVGLPDGVLLPPLPLCPSAFSLHPCIPNPFNPSTAISYELRAASHVTLKVYDTSGRQLATLVDGLRNAGTHEVTFDGSSLASGIYLAKLEAGEFTAVQKLVLMK